MVKIISRGEDPILDKLYDRIVELQQGARTAVMLNPGQTLFDDYRIDAIVDAGSFGIVYRASELLTGYTVAIKVAPKEPSPSFSVEDALAEGRLWRSLTGSPHVVQLFAVKRGPEDGQVSFVMEYMGGGNLASRLRNGPLPFEEVRRLAEALCGAVGYVHSRTPKVLHRDLKPQNILLSESGSIKVGDFGIGRVLEEGALAYSDSGTPLYKAPEVIVGRGYDHRADLWSIGVILFEALFGRPPFVGRDAEELYTKVLNEEPDFPESASPSVRDFFKRALAKKPEDRFETAEDLLVHFRRVTPPHVWKVEEPEGGYRDEEDRTKRVLPASALVLPPGFAPVKGCKIDPASGLPMEVICEKDGAPMVLVPAGEFLMGSAEGDKGAFDDEKPQRRVYLDAFYIDKYEVTNALYGKFMQATGHMAPDFWNNSSFNTPNQPVVEASWYDAEAYCKRAGKRLPTEAEWESGARGTDGRTYPWGNQWDKTLANTYEGGPGSPTPVGSYEGGKSPYGAYDMAGNVWEWVEDWYGFLYQWSPGRNPKGPDSGSSKVVRGGSWLHPPWLACSSYRRHHEPYVRYYALGFRCAR